MTEKTIPIEKEGVFLFKAPSRLRVALDRQLLVVLAVPNPRACALLVYDPLSAVRELPMMLDMLVAKLHRDHNVAAGQLVVKVFGLSRGERTTLKLLYRWLTVTRLQLAAEDVGKNACRSVIVDCATGQVGVSYAEAHAPGVPLLLSAGSARERLGGGEVAGRALVLTANPVRRQLARQVTEEAPGWLAETPDSPATILAKLPKRSAPWNTVLVFEDVFEKKANIATFLRWAKAMKKFSPETAIFLCGDGFAPATRRQLLPLVSGSLPELKPDALGEFKDAYAAELGDAFGWSTGRVVRFPKRRTGR